MSDPDRRQRGFATFGEVMQFTPPDMPGDVFLDATIEHLFGAVWSRPGLGVRERRLITLTILMGLGNEMTLRLHFGAAMKSGDLSDTEIDELILHVAHYGGWPQAAVASQVVRQLRAERDRERTMGAARDPTARSARRSARAARSHAERSAATRAKILAAVVDVIADATASSVSRRSEVASARASRGAPSSTTSAARTSCSWPCSRTPSSASPSGSSTSPVAGTSLAARAALFVDHAWEHFRSRHYRATFEILLNYLGREEHAGAGNWRLEMSRAWDRVWSRIFADAKLPRKRSLMLQHFTVSTLSGLAATLMLQGRRRAPEGRARRVEGDAPRASSPPADGAALRHPLTRRAAARTLACRSATPTARGAGGMPCDGVSERRWSLGLLVGYYGRPAGATFHIVSISELGSGFSGAADVQFVELRLDAGAHKPTRPIPA